MDSLGSMQLRCCSPYGRMTLRNSSRSVLKHIVSLALGARHIISPRWLEEM